MDEAELKQELRMKMQQGNTQQQVSQPQFQQPIQQGNPQVQQPVQQKPVVEKKPVMQQKWFKVLWFLIKVAIFVGFFYGAYWVLKSLGIIDKIMEGFLLFSQI